jgi:hypothetical protein
MSTWQGLALVALLILGLWLVLVIIDRKRSPGTHPNPSLEETLRVARRFASLFAMGLASAIAGYLPIVIAGEPSLNGVNSRVNTFASFGGSLMVVSILGVLAALTSRRGSELKRLLAAGTAPLLALAMITQVWAQYDARTAWREQTQIWRELFVLAPDIVDGTMVYIVLPGYEDRVGFENWRRTPLFFGWEPSSAIQLLYGKRDLNVNVIFPNVNPGIGMPVPTENRILDPYPEGVSTSYDRALFVVFDGSPRHLRVLEDLQSELAINWPTPTYQPYERVSRGPPPLTEWRHLVGVPRASGNDIR